MLGTTLPTPLYPAYEARFGFGALTVTVVFAVYAVGVLTALMLFGRASDALGRRPVLLGGLAMSLLSTTVFLTVSGLHHHGLPLLLVGRFLSGLSAGVFTGTATATLLDFARPGRQQQASLIAAVANIGGLGLGPVTGGVLARWVDAPLRTCFLVHLALVVVAVLAVTAAPEPLAVDGPRRLQVNRLTVPPQVRSTLVRAGTAGFAGFAVLGMFAAVTPALLGLLGHHNPALTGVVVFSVFASSAGGQVASVRVPPRPSLLAGTATLVAGMALVGVAIGQQSLGLLVAGGILSGVGQGLSFRAALAAVTSSSPPEQRGGVASTFFAVCYVGISLPVVGIGVGTRSWGLVHTGETFSAIVAALALAALVSIARTSAD